MHFLLPREHTILSGHLEWKKVGRTQHTFWNWRNVKDNRCPLNNNHHLNILIRPLLMEFFIKNRFVPFISSHLILSQIKHHWVSHWLTGWVASHNFVCVPGSPGRSINIHLGHTHSRVSTLHHLVSHSLRVPLEFNSLWLLVGERSSDAMLQQLSTPTHYHWRGPGGL